MGTSVCWPGDSASNWARRSWRFCCCSGVESREGSPVRTLMDGAKDVDLAGAGTEARGGGFELKHGVQKVEPLGEHDYCHRGVRGAEEVLQSDSAEESWEWSRGGGYTV